MHERVKIHLTYMQKKRKWREKISFDYFNSFYQIHHFILSELIQIFQFYLNKIDKNLNYLHIKILTIFYSEIHKMQRNKLNKPFFLISYSHITLIISYTYFNLYKVLSSLRISSSAVSNSRESGFSNEYSSDNCSIKYPFILSFCEDNKLIFLSSINS